MLITAYKRKFVGRYKRLAENQNSREARRLICLNSQITLIVILIHWKTH
jgi:hypothetical protein